MSKAKSVSVVLAAFGLLTAGIVSWKYRPKPQPQEISVAEGRLAELRTLVEQDRLAADDGLRRYAPRSKAHVDDLAADLCDILRQVPGVAGVESLVRPDKPTHRIVHLRDWRFVPKDLYAADLRAAAQHPLSDDEIDLRHAELSLEVELVQLEQLALLRCLIRHHGLKDVFAEGLTPKGLANFREQTTVLKGIERDQVPQLLKQLTDLRELKETMAAAGRERSERYARADVIEQEIAQMLEQHQQRLRELGAAGRLRIADEVKEVLPLDDADLLEQAKPTTPSDLVHFDREKVQARHDAQVKAALGRGPFALVVLGGAHDLSDSVRRLGGGRCEYVRVTTWRVQKFMGEGPK